jgi:hypothetical protein
METPLHTLASLFFFYLYLTTETGKVVKSSSRRCGFYNKSHGTSATRRDWSTGTTRRPFSARFIKLDITARKSLPTCSARANNLSMLCSLETLLDGPNLSIAIPSALLALI